MMTGDERVHPSPRDFDLGHFPTIILDIAACYCCIFLGLPVNPGQDICSRVRVNRQMTTARFRRIQSVFPSFLNRTTRAIKGAHQEPDRDFGSTFDARPIQEINELMCAKLKFAESRILLQSKADGRTEAISETKFRKFFEWNRGRRAAEFRRNLAGKERSAGLRSILIVFAAQT
jgi:hypothetical protein